MQETVLSHLKRHLDSISAAWARFPEQRLVNKATTTQSDNWEGFLCLPTTILATFMKFSRRFYVHYSDNFSCLFNVALSVGRIAAKYIP